MKRLMIATATALPLVMAGAAFAASPADQELASQIEVTLGSLGITDVQLNALSHEQLAILYADVNGQDNRAAKIRKAKDDLAKFTAGPAQEGGTMQRSSADQQLADQIEVSLGEMGVTDVTLDNLNHRQLATLYDDISGTSDHATKIRRAKNDLASFDVGTAQASRLSSPGADSNLVATVQQMLNAHGIRADASTMSRDKVAQIYALGSTNGDGAQHWEEIAKLVKS